MSRLQEVISQTVWDLKYRYRDGSQIIDQSIEDTWLRVAKAVAAPEKAADQLHWQGEFYRILEDFRFLPGGRILAGAGTAHRVTLFNCFVMNIAQDSLSGIFDALAEGALTLQQGGGVGYDFSKLRPKGDYVKKTGIPSSGPISFMRIWDTMCSVMLSTGARRGAMMGILRCDHPDIEEFIAAKSDPKELRHFNVSVMVSDEFLAAVKQDKDWALVFPAEDASSPGEVIYRPWVNDQEAIACRVYKKVKARDLWDKIIHSAYEYAEPGVLFSDTINRMNNLWYRERIDATNPCGEIPLPPYGACNLGAINLTQFIASPFTDVAKIDWAGIEETTRIATRFLDNVIDISHYPLEAQREQAMATRRIGLGITGLADIFVMLGIEYGSPESINLSRELMQRIMEVTWETSITLAKEKGVFPTFDKKYLQGEFVKTLNESLQRDIEKYGIRNSHHNTIAPTGTISLLANNVSNGIEPIFRSSYVRHVREADGGSMSFTVKDYAYQLWRKEVQEKMPPAWVDTETLPPQAHLHVQAALQPYIDNAISKTINIPRNFPFEKLASVYLEAYELGLKGCTIFRPNPTTGSILEVPEERCCQFETDQ